VNANISPQFANPSVSPTNLLLGDSINLSVNASDDVGVNYVEAEIFQQGLNNNSKFSKGKVNLTRNGGINSHIGLPSSSLGWGTQRNLQFDFIPDKLQNQRQIVTTTGFTIYVGEATSNIETDVRIKDASSGNILAKKTVYADSYYEKKINFVDFSLSDYSELPKLNESGYPEDLRIQIDASSLPCCTDGVIHDSDGDESRNNEYFSVKNKIPLALDGGSTQPMVQATTITNSSLVQHPNYEPGRWFSTRQFEVNSSQVEYNTTFTAFNVDSNSNSTSVSRIVENQAPDQPQLVSPSDGVNKGDDINLSVFVKDFEADSMNISYYWENGTKIGENTGVGNDTITFLELSDLEYGKTYNWYTVVSDQYNSSTSSTWNFSYNYAPRIGSSKFIDDRKNDLQQLVLGLDSRGESDIDDFSGVSSVSSFTNNSLKKDISLPFSATVSVSDLAGLVSNTTDLDISEIDSGVREDSFDHSESLQRINRTVTLFNDAVSSIDYELVLDLAGTVVQGQSWTGTIPGSGSVTHTAVTEGDWIKNEQESSYEKYADPDYSHSEDEQRIVNRTELNVDNTAPVTFSSLDISSICSKTSHQKSLYVNDRFNNYNSDTWNLERNASYDSTNDRVQLTSESASLQGDLKYRYKVNTSRFVAKFRANSFNSDGDPGADGIRFEWGSDYFIHLDNFENPGDLEENTLKLVSKDSGLIKQVGMSKYNISFEDGTPENIKLVVYEGKVRVFVDNIEIIDENIENYETSTSGLRFFATTGGYDAKHVVDDVKLIDPAAPVGENVEVTTDCNRPTFLVDTISQSVTDLQQDASTQNSLSTQYAYKRKDLTENSGYSYSSVDISPPNLDGSCSNCNSRTRDVGASSTVSEFYNSSSDWITNEEESTYTKYSDSEFDHTEDGQQIVNRTQLVADNSQSFTFNNVDISGTCSETTSADVSPATGFLVTDDCNRPEFSVDFISESVGEEFVDSSFSHSLSSQGLALYKNISETGGYSFNEVNVSSPVLDGTCENCVERTTDISGNGEASFVYNSTGDWITGENRSTFSKYSDTGFNHTEDGQRIVNRTKLVVDNERSSEFRDVDLSSTCSETVSGSVPSGSGVEVTTDCTRNSFTGDWISTDTSEEASDPSYGHSLSSQGVFVAKNLSEDGGFSWSNVSVSTPAINGSCENCGMRNVSLNADSSVTEYYNSSSDWINVVSESTTEIGQNTSIEATVDSQTLYNQSRLSVDNNRSFSFNDVDVSSKCSSTTSVDVPSGQSVVTEACNNDSFTGDWITNEANSSTEYVSGGVLIGEEATESFEASQDVEVTNVRSNSDLSVNLESMLESVTGCNLQNSTTQNIPASTASSLDFLKSCSPGQHLNRTPVLKTETSDFYKYDIEFGFEVESNLTEEQDIRYAAKKEWLDNWNSRDPTETEAFVNGRSQDVSVSEQIINGTEYVVVTVGDEYGNSSLHKGTHEASLSYYETKSPGSTSGTSGGGSTLISSSSGEERLVENVSSDKYNWTVSIVSTEDTQSYQVSGYPGASFENFIVLENTGDSNVTLDIECVDVKEACDWVDVSVDRVVLNRNDFSEKVVTVSGDIPESFGGEDAPASFSIKVSDPRANGTDSEVGVEYVDFTVTNNPISGRVLDTALKVFEWRELESPVSWGNPVPYPFVFLPAFWTLLFAGAWWGLERVSPVKSRPDSRWVVSIGLFLVLFVVL
jgi:hypothetical protein